MKRWIHASEKYESELLNILSEQFGSSNPQTGCTFIMPDGEFLNIYPTLDTHEDLCEWIQDNTSYEFEYPDGEYFTREFGFIRLRNDPSMMIIELPAEIPSYSQWDSLESWLEFCEARHPNGVTLYLNVCDGADADVEYHFATEYFAEDIIKICKRYYSSGKLYASTDLIESSIKLGTTRFTAPSIKTDEQRNALEALEIAITQKEDQFEKFCDRQFYLTSSSSWTGVIDQYEEGYYIQLEATRAQFNAFVAGDSVIRKPRQLSDKIASFRVSGDHGTVDWMSSARVYNKEEKANKKMEDKNK